MSKFEIIRDNQITLGGYLLFAADYCAISDIQIGRFKSESTIIDSLALSTDLFSETDQILAFIKKHLMVEYIITQNAQNIERFDYPIEAIREIVINMIVHRDYKTSAASIIKIFDDRIEFYNPGKLIGNITIENLLSNNYTSQSRNKLIAKAFKEVGLIERYGSGIRRILTICEEYGIIKPLIEEAFDGIRFVLYKTRLNVVGNVAGNVADKTGVEVVESPYLKGIHKNNITDHVADNVVDDVVDKRLKLIIVLITENNKISTSQLAKQLKITNRTVQRDLEKLKKLKKIQRIGNEKSGYWKILENKR